MSKLYRFNANSSLSFRVINRGREMAVTFSQCYRGSSSFFTHDAELAALIRAHKWFRTGRIKEVEIEDDPVPATPTVETETQTPKRTYSIRGRRMVSVPASTPTVEEEEKKEEVAPEAVTDAPTVETETTAETAEETAETGFSPESVSTFYEAKEYVLDHFEDADRTQLRSKERLYEFCQAHGLTFPNYSFE
jgi:hypothetical protein